MEEFDIRKLKIVPYVRKSKIDKDEKGILSIDDQIKVLRSYAERQKLNLLDFVEENASAYHSGRKEFARVQQMIMEGSADAILAYNITRIARNPTDGMWILEQLREGNLVALITPEKVYRADSDDYFWLYIQFGFSQKQSDDTSKYVKRDLQGKLDRQEFPNFVCAPYLNIDKEGRISGKSFETKKMVMLNDLGRQMKRIELDPIEAPLWRQLGLEIIKNHYTLGQATIRGQQLGIKGKYSEGKVSKATIERTFENPFIYGMMRYKGNLYQGNHDPLFTKSEFMQINAVFQRTNKAKYDKNNKWFNKYNGICVCGECGRAWSTEPPKYNGIIYLRCSKSRKDYKCCQKYLALDEFERQIEDALKEVYISDGLMQLILTKFEQVNKLEADKNESVRISLQTKVNNTKAQLKNLTLKYISPANTDGSIIPEAEYVALKEALNKELAEHEEEYTKICQVENNWVDHVKEFFDFARDLSSLYSNMGYDLDAKRRLVNMVASNIVIKDQKARIEYKEPFTFLKIMHSEIQSEIVRFEDLKAMSEQEKVPFYQHILVRQRRG